MSLSLNLLYSRLLDGSHIAQLGFGFFPSLCFLLHLHSLSYKIHENHIKTEVENFINKISVDFSLFRWIQVTAPTGLKGFIKIKIRSNIYHAFYSTSRSLSLNQVKTIFDILFVTFGRRRVHKFRRV